jgi:hypothetical protein
MELTVPGQVQQQTLLLFGNYLVTLLQLVSSFLMAALIVFWLTKTEILYHHINMVFGYLNILTEPIQIQKMMDVLFLKYVVKLLIGVNSCFRS